MHTIAIVNQKGGCGKTTSAVNLAGVFAKLGKRTLLVDLDPQSHCAAGLAIPEQRVDMHVGDAMLHPERFDAQRLLWRVSRNLDLIPASVRLAAVEAPRGGLSDKPEPQRRLARVLTRLSDRYDIALLDCPPTIGLLTFNALIASSEVLIPVETGFFSLQGAQKQINTIRSLGRKLGVNLPYRLVPTMYDSTSALAKDLLDELHRRFGAKVCPHVVRFDQSLREAVSFGQPVVEYNPQSAGAEDYTVLARWLADNPLHGSARSDADTPLESDIGDEPHVPAAEPAPITNGANPHAASLGEAFAAADSPPSHASASASPTTVLGQDVTSPQHVAAAPALTPMPVTELVPAREVTGRPTRAAVSLPTPDDLTRDRAADLLERARRLQARLNELSSATPASPGPSPSGGPSTRATDTDSGFIPGSSARGLAPGIASPGPGGGRGSGLFGVRVTSQGVLFVQPASLGSSLALAGDFNNWRPELSPMTFREDMGLFEVCLDLPPGRHQYRVVADGRWLSDPFNPLCQVNPFGESNSYVDVMNTVVRSRSPESLPSLA